MFMDWSVRGLLVVLSLGIGLLVLGCDDGAEEYEGDDPGECGDGADNDQDGLFDCADPDCGGSPACMAGDADADSDGDSDGDADGDSDSDSDLTHDEVLEQLNVNLAPADRLDPAGDPVDSDRSPLGRATTTLLRRSEVFTAGFASNGRNQYLYEDQREAWAPIHSLTDESWVAASHKNIVGADVDGDGFEEVVIVYYLYASRTLELLVIDRVDGAYEEHRATIATAVSGGIPPIATKYPDLSVGDFDGDGRDEIAVAYTRVYVVEDMVEDFEVTSREYPDAWFITLAAGELDGDGQDELVVTHELESYVYADIFDGDLSAELIEENALLHAPGVDGGHTLGASVRVQLADLDGDSLDEMVFYGQRNEGSNFSDWTLTARDDAQHDLRWLPLFQFVGCDGCVIRDFAVYDGDGDGRENEIHTRLHQFRWNPDTETMENPGNVTHIENCRYEPCSAYPEETHRLWAGDVNGDGRDEVLYYSGGGAAAGVYMSTWGAASHELVIPGAWTYTSRLGLVNVDDDSPIISYRNEHEVLFTDPTPIAVLACPPYHADAEQCFGRFTCGTTYGTETTSGVETETSTGFSVGFSIGFSAEDPLGLASAEVMGTFASSFGWSSSASTEITSSFAYTSGADEDKVVFTSIPFDVYYYDIVSSPDAPEQVGQVMSINVPRRPETYSVSREFYNANNGDFPDIGEPVLGHTIGVVDSYPTLGDALTLLEDGGLYSTEQGGGEPGARPVGVGTGQETATISFAESSGSGSFEDVEVGAESQASAFGVAVGSSVGFQYGWSGRIYNIERTFYQGVVGDIPDDLYTSELGYSFGLFAYPFSSEGQTFTVVNYWVE